MLDGKEAEVRRSTGMVGVLTALLALCVIVAPAQATRYQFSGDKGTSCSVDVTANASTTIGVLSGTPRVGFGSNPVCQYAAAAASKGQGGSAGAKAAKACKPKAKSRAAKRKARRCKAKRKAHPRAVTRVVSVPALLDLAKLNLLAPLGIKVPGEETLASLGVGGYTCLLGVGANCSDIGQLEPAIPFVGYSSQFSIRLAPPPGEHWVSVPAGCSGAPAVSCVLTSPTVVPTL
jgi:hypothetical protein